jgi:hypothetical protein
MLIFTYDGSLKSITQCQATVIDESMLQPAVTVHQLIRRRLINKEMPKLFALKLKVIDTAQMSVDLDGKTTVEML